MMLKAGKITLNNIFATQQEKSALRKKFLKKLATVPDPVVPSAPRGGIHKATVLTPAAVSKRSASSACDALEAEPSAKSRHMEDADVNDERNASSPIVTSATPNRDVTDCKKNFTDCKKNCNDTAVQLNNRRLSLIDHSYAAADVTIIEDVIMGEVAVCNSAVADDISIVNYVPAGNRNASKVKVESSSPVASPVAADVTDNTAARNEGLLDCSNIPDLCVLDCEAVVVVEDDVFSTGASTGVGDTCQSSAPADTCQGSVPVDSNQSSVSIDSCQNSALTSSCSIANVQGGASATEMMTRDDTETVNDCIRAQATQLPMSATRDGRHGAAAASTVSIQHQCYDVCARTRSIARRRFSVAAGVCWSGLGRTAMIDLWGC